MTRSRDLANQVNGVGPSSGTVTLSSLTLGGAFNAQGDMHKQAYGIDNARIRVYRNAALTLSNGTTTTILFDTEVDDDLSTFDTSTGKWNVSSLPSMLFWYKFHIEFLEASPLYKSQIEFKLSRDAGGTPYFITGTYGHCVRESAAGETNSFGSSGLVRVGGGESHLYVSVWIYHALGSNTALVPGADTCYFEAWPIAFAED